ncbi:MAG: putative motility protein [Hydrogenophaga sp.]|uniref:putative motility protein n=1 Tax=Hydrogenophaga sp. TaxID=1904254 RepID=UPI0025C34EE1|nr:putative motility protein [Hydrogenophaga sp.]MCG2657292.1 putative motility protein [Hydrogenophaga sp.]
MDMDVSPALLMDRVLQTRQGQTAQEAQIFVMNKAMDMQESASAALLNAVAGDLPLASGGSVGTQVNTLV